MEGSLERLFTGSVVVIRGSILSTLDAFQSGLGTQTLVNPLLDNRVRLACFFSVRFGRVLLPVELLEARIKCPRKVRSLFLSQSNRG